MRHRIKLALAGVLTLAAICAVNIVVDRNQTAILSPGSVETSKITKVMAPAYLTYGDGTPVVVLHPGDTFFAHSNFTRTEQCPWSVVISLTGLENRLNMQLESAQDWLPLGSYEKNEQLIIPVAAVPGPYHVVKRLINYCDGEAYLSTLFDIRVEIVTVDTK